MENSLSISYKTKCDYYMLGNCIVVHLFQRNENECPHKSCTRMFIATLWVIDKTWKWHKCSAGRQLNKLWHIYAREYYAPMKRNALDTRDNLDGLFIDFHDYWSILVTEYYYYYWYMAQLRWISREFGWLRKASVKVWHTTWWHSYNVLEITKS